jgi:uncharacterized Rmd1/YagE family protein
MSELPTARDRYITVRALLLGDRIETAGLERNDVLSKIPLAFRADALATSVILAHDEKNVAKVFDVIQPIARELAEHGRTPGGSSCNP